jgi:transposase, IS30 family
MSDSVRRLGRPSLPRELVFRFWDEYLAGQSIVEAADTVGVSHSTGENWVRKAGGVAPQDRKLSGRYLSHVEREVIALGVAAGKSTNQIGEEIGRPGCTVRRELKRNAPSAGPYRASVADSKAQLRGKRPKPRKITRNPVLAAMVQGGLEQGWSPEQISGRLRLLVPDNPDMSIHHETIYQCIYIQGKGGLNRELAECLRTGRALRRPRRKHGERRGRIPGMVSISERPAEADDRAVPGHWEGDLIIGKNSKSAIGTLVERTSRCVCLLHLPGAHDAVSLRDAVVPVIQSLPERLTRSLTWDRGSEMARHAEISIAADIDIYFADPHSPWQRGSNENANGLLRQFFPKGADLSQYTAEDLNHAETQLNTRPRKTLGFKTPNEVLAEVLSQPAA